MDRDCEFFDRYNNYLQNPRSKFEGSQDRFHDDFAIREYVLDGPNIECFKCHNYDHSARGSNIRRNHIWTTLNDSSVINMGTWLEIAEIEGLEKEIGAGRPSR